MAGEYNLSVILSARNQAAGVLSGFASQLGGVGTGLLAVAGIAVGVGAASIKMAGDFQQGVTQLVTGAGESTKNIGMIKQGLLDMSVQTATSTTALTNGLYMIESAGYHGATGLQVLQAAAMGAKVGNADLATVADGLTTAMTDYNIPTSKAVDVTNLLVATVANGKTHMQDLTASLSVILPTAAASGVGLNQVAGAMATMTGEGISARQAAQSLRMTIMALDAPSASAQKEFKLMGLSSSEVASRMKTDLPGALKEITDAVGKKFPEGSAGYMAALKAMLGGNNQMQGVLDLTGAHMATFKGNVAGIANAVSGAHGQINGWALAQQDFNFKLQQAQMAANKLMVELGTALIPVVLNLMNGIQNVISTGQRFISWLSGSSAGATATKIALVVLGGAILGFAAAAIPALVAGFVAWAAAAWTAAAGTIAATWPFILIGAVIALVVVGIVLAIQHWGQIMAWLRGVWTAFTSWFGGIMSNIGSFFHNVWNGISTFFVNVWNGIVNFARSALNNFLNAFTAPFRAIGALFIWLYNHNYYFKALVDTIRIVTQAVLSWLQNAWQATVNWIVNAWNWLKDTATSVFNAVKDAIMGPVNWVVGWLTALWNAEVLGIQIIWNKLSGFAQNAWNAVVNVFRSVWGPIGSALSGLWNNISNWFSNLASQALQWGKNLIQGFINGITSMIGGVINAAQGIANGVKNILGFHSPAKEGPGKDADTWAPNFVKMYAAGILAGIPAVKNAVNQLAGTLQPGVNIGIGSAGAASRLGTSSGQVINAPINLTVNGSVVDHTKLLKDLQVQQEKQFRQQGIHVAIRSGGKTA